MTICRFGRSSPHHQGGGSFVVQITGRLCTQLIAHATFHLKRICASAENKVFSAL